jgi:hypothetical protein
MSECLKDHGALVKNCGNIGRIDSIDSSMVETSFFS